MVAQMVKNLPAMQETWVWSLGWEDPLEEGMATHSSILAWRIHGQRSLASYSPWGSQNQIRLSNSHTHTHTHTTEQLTHIHTHRRLSNTHTHTRTHTPWGQQEAAEGSRLQAPLLADWTTKGASRPIWGLEGRVEGRVWGQRDGETALKQGLSWLNIYLTLSRTLLSDWTELNWTEF